MSMSLRENITAVIETCFSETKDEIQNTAINRILELIRVDRETESQRDCFLCKWLGEVDVCGRCRNRNLFCKAELQPRCPKCGVRGYIRSLESMGVKLKKFDEYKWKCTNCNKYFKEEPKDEPQTLKGGEDVHEFCKKCGESKARMIGGERYIVCEKASDLVCISMKECPLGKWVCEDTYIVVPQMDCARMKE